MPIGLALPVGVDTKGSAKRDSDDVAYNKKILYLAFGDNDDKNDFQNLGLDQRLIFQIRSPGFLGKAEAEINRILTKFNGRIALDPRKPMQLDTTNPGEAELIFEYIDLLVNEEQEFRRGFVR